jgi:hypothetical protein
MTTDPRVHQETWSLLPWLANGSATAVQRQRAEAHLAECAACRAELVREQRLAAGLARPGVPGPDLHQGLDRLMQRLDQAAPAAPLRPWQGVRSGGGVQIRLSTAALLGGLQLALVAAGAAWWLHAGAPAVSASGDEGAYQTLTQPAGPGTSASALRVVFDAARPVAEVQALLVTQGLVIVNGPTAAGVFTLAPASTTASSQPRRDLDALAADLRRSPAVAFAEAIAPAAAQ